MLYASVFLVFIFILSVLYCLLYLINGDKIVISKRMEQIENIDKIHYSEDENKTFFQRVLSPVFNSITKIFTKLTPDYKKKQLSFKLEQAGILKKITVEKWMLRKILITIIISITAGIGTYLLTKDILKSMLFIILSLLFINVLFRFLIAKKIKERKENIARDLPYTMDLITVSVEAGLSFDGAIAKVINNIKGDISYEFSKTLKEIRMGIERKNALRNMGDRCNVDVLSTFITSIIQADELGVSLGKVLRIESSQLREYRKQSARERAMKAPVKMLFPLIFFIFPAIFVIILGPAIIRIFEFF